MKTVKLTQFKPMQDELLKLREENKSLRQSLSELIPIAEWLKSEYPIDFYLYFKESSIQRAKASLSQP